MTVTLRDTLEEEVVSPTAFGDEEWEQDAWEKDDAPDWLDKDDDEDDEDDDGYDEGEEDSDDV